MSISITLGDHIINYLIGNRNYWQIDRDLRCIFIRDDSMRQSGYGRDRAIALRNSFPTESIKRTPVTVQTEGRVHHA